MNGERPACAPTWRCQGPRKSNRWYGVENCRGSSRARQIASALPESRTISTSAIRLDFDRASAAAVRLSIAAAMLIAKPVFRKLFIFFSVTDLWKERSTKGNDRAVAAGWNIRMEGTRRCHLGALFWHVRGRNSRISAATHG